MLQARSECKTIDAYDINDENDFQLVHITGKTSVDGTVCDPELGVEMNGVYRLRRIVEMYQWHQNARHLG